MADCYFGLNETENAIKYLKIALEEKEKTLFPNQETIEEEYERKIYLIKNNMEKYIRKSSKLQRVNEKAMRRMLLKFAKYLYAAFQPGCKSESELLGSIVDKLKMLTFPRILNN